MELTEERLAQLESMGRRTFSHDEPNLIYAETLLALVAAAREQDELRVTVQRMSDEIESYRAEGIYPGERSKMLQLAERLENERDALRADCFKWAADHEAAVERAERAETERDALRAEVARLRAGIEEARSRFDGIDWQALFEDEQDAFLRGTQALADAAD